MYRKESNPKEDEYQQGMKERKPPGVQMKKVRKDDGRRWVPPSTQITDYIDYTYTHGRQPRPEDLFCRNIAKLQEPQACQDGYERDCP